MSDSSKENTIEMTDLKEGDKMPAIYSSVEIQDESDGEQDAIIQQSDKFTIKREYPQKLAWYASFRQSFKNLARVDSDESYGEKLLKQSKAGLKTNWIPAVVLSGFCFLLIILYYTVDSVSESFNSIADYKQQTGYAWAFFGTAICGGFIPWVVLVIRTKYQEHTSNVITELSPAETKRNIYLEGAWLTVFWGYRGVEVDAFYRLQAIMFGDGNDPSVIAPKVFVDLIVYNIVWAAHSVQAGYMIKDANFNCRVFLSKYNRNYFLYTIPSLLVACWIVWLPVVTIVYSLPGPLQVPMFNVAVCFWGIALAIIAKT